MGGEGGRDRQGTEDPASTSAGIGCVVDEQRMGKERDAKQGFKAVLRVPRNEEGVGQTFWLSSRTPVVPGGSVVVGRNAAKSTRGRREGKYLTVFIIILT
jgi:hypothetical protein